MVFLLPGFPYSMPMVLGIVTQVLATFSTGFAQVLIKCIVFGWVLKSA